MLISTRLAPLLLSVVFVTPDAVAAAAPLPWSVTSGIDVSRGDYGLSIATEMISLPLALGWRSGQWSLRATTSLTRWSGPEGSVVVDGVSVATSTTTVTQSGRGDSTVSVKYSLEAGSRSICYGD
ncbi:hypothetical protein D5085_18050 [Ectothiorhodospiraceae bacterium BW-2]|nr:hypothetical protein D5085_18050 [Ectothiorhodospiraceae bacterium BW-2]